MSPSGVPGHLDWTKLAQCTTRLCILQNKTIIMPLRHILRMFLIFLTKSPCGAPWGPDLNIILHAQRTTKPWDQQHETINGSLRYLVTEEIEEQHIVYGQTAGRHTKGYRISSTGLWPVELKLPLLKMIKKHYTNNIYLLLSLEEDITICSTQTTFMSTNCLLYR